MSEKFEVGEIAILRSGFSYPEHVGREVTIVSAPYIAPYDGSFCAQDAGKEAYDIAAPFLEQDVPYYSSRGRSCWYTLSSELRKRPPPPNWNALAYSKPRDVETTEQV